MTTKWKHTIKLKHLFINLNEEDLTVKVLQKVAKDISDVLMKFCTEHQKEPDFKTVHWLNVNQQFLRLSIDEQINVDMFDGVMDDLYDLADDHEVWVE